MTTGVPADASRAIADGRKVSLEYTLTLEDGTAVQSNVGGKPFRYQQGKGQIVPGLEKALAGLHVGDHRRVTVAPDEGYGQPKAENRRTVPLEKVPPEARHVGAEVTAQGFPGPVRVAEVRDDGVVLDFNHPLAGKTLVFDVHVIAVD